MSDGKFAESEVQRLLTEFQNPEFDWQRLYDSHSAKSYIPAQVADFLWFCKGKNGAIEVKETELEHKLKREAFGDMQLAKLRARSWAGGHVHVISYHYEYGHWYLTPWSEMEKAFYKKGLKTLDLKSTSRKFSTCDEAMIELFTEVI